MDHDYINHHDNHSDRQSVQQLDQDFEREVVVGAHPRRSPLLINFGDFFYPFFWNYLF